MEPNTYNVAIVCITTLIIVWRVFHPPGMNERAYVPEGRDGPSDQYKQIGNLATLTHWPTVEAKIKIERHVKRGNIEDRFILERAFRGTHAFVDPILARLEKGDYSALATLSKSEAPQESVEEITRSNRPDFHLGEAIVQERIQRQERAAEEVTRSNRPDFHLGEAIAQARIQEQERAALD